MFRHGNHVGMATRLCLVVVSAMCTLAVPADAERNLLSYGDSFTLGSRVLDMCALWRWLAIVASPPRVTLTA